MSKTETVIAKLARTDRAAFERLIPRANRVTPALLRQARKDGRSDLSRGAKSDDVVACVAARIAIADLYGVK